MKHTPGPRRAVIMNNYDQAYGEIKWIMENIEGREG